MKKLFVLCTAVIALIMSCNKSGSAPAIPSDMPRTDIPAELRATWMHGEFSLTEYWTTDPSTYLGPAYQVAFAFTFKSDGTYVQYFTWSSVMNGVTTYHQSVTHGTAEVDETTKTIKTHAASAHYKRTSGGINQEDRDLLQEELNSGTYNYTTGIEPNGTSALYITLKGTTEPLTFLKKE